MTPEDLIENERKKAELIDLIVSENAIAFVGAGSSTKAGYPTWDKFLAILEEAACSLPNAFIKAAVRQNEEYLEYAQRLKDHFEQNGVLNREYKSRIAEVFAPKPPVDFHKKLVRLPFRCFITTNYDNLLQNSLQCNGATTAKVYILGHEPPLAREFFDSLMSKEWPPWVVHAHGIYSNADSIVLARKEYEAKYGIAVDGQAGPLKKEINELTVHHYFLWALLATRRVVFIGFSADDPYLRLILDRVAQDTWSYRQNVHYAIHPLPVDEAEASIERKRTRALWNEFGIATVFYEKKDSDTMHSGLDYLIDEILAAHLRNEAAKRLSDEESLEVAEPNIDRAPEGTRPSSSDMSATDALNAASQEMRRRIKQS